MGTMNIMAMIREKDRDALGHLASRLTREVDATLYTQRASPLMVPGVIPTQTCKFAEELLSELAVLIPKLKVNIVDLVDGREQAEREGVVRVPTIVIGGSAQRRVRFIGFPGGYGASTFFKSLLDAGGIPDGLSEETRARIAQITTPADMKIFVAPTSPYCPPMASLAISVAVANSNVTVSIVEAGEFPDIAQRYDVCDVPRTVIDEDDSIEGVVPANVLLERLVTPGTRSAS